VIRRLLALLLCLVPLSAAAFWQSRDSNYNSSIASGSSYTGPGDVVSGATAWYGLRAYNAAYATGSNNALNVRRASDNTTQNIVILSNGNLDIATANTFAGVDATASATATASTTLGLTGASSTPHVGSTITGTGVTQPCYIVSVGTFTGGSGTVVVNQAQTLAAVSISMQYGLYITEAYDQSGNSNNATQGTASAQPQLLPNAINGLPAMGFRGAQYLTASAVFSGLPGSVSAVAERTGVFTSYSEIIDPLPGSSFDFANTANTVHLYNGSGGLTATAADSQAHSLQGLFASVGSGGISTIVVDGSATTGGTGDTVTSGNSAIGATNSGADPLTGLIGQVGAWGGTLFTSTQYGNLRSNDKSFWNTP
jgi:hypothetical protein